MTVHVVLVGLMATGKSTVGQGVADALDRPLLDSDEEVEARTGRSVREIWKAEGEAAFRVLETEALRDALARDQPAVIAAAGGVVLSAVNRRRLHESCSRVVWLRADPATLAARIQAAGQGHRPLLDADPLGTLSRMARDRTPLYEEVADLVIDVDRLSLGEAVERIVEVVRSSIRVDVALQDRTYPVLVGRGVRDELAAVVPGRPARVAVVTQAQIGVVVDPGVEHRTFTVAQGEPAKSMATVEELCRLWAQWGLTRADCVVAVGGGVVTDTAGFAASVYHRGISVVHVPTTLLGMIDAAIGGKTGVNLPEGKNLVGAFWQPAAVLCDLDTLDTLPPVERRSGLGEMAKYRFLPGGDDIETLSFESQIARCVAIKAEVVASDEREGGRRAILNYGHTLAHAIETAGSYDLRHGEAVAVGLRYAAGLARRLGRIDDDRVALHDRILADYDLPSHLPDGVDDDALLALMGRDKKAVNGLTFALDGPDGVEVVAGVDPDEARRALAEVRS